MLRQSRAELRSPTRFSTEAARIGMRPAATSQFVPVDADGGDHDRPHRGGARTIRRRIASLQPLDQFRLVKALYGESP